MDYNRIRYDIETYFFHLGEEIKDMWFEIKMNLLFLSVRFSDAKRIIKNLHEIHKLLPILLTQKYPNRFPGKRKEFTISDRERLRKLTQIFFAREAKSFIEQRREDKESKSDIALSNVVRNSEDIPNVLIDEKNSSWGSIMFFDRILSEESQVRVLLSPNQVDDYRSQIILDRFLQFGYKPESTIEFLRKCNDESDLGRVWEYTHYLLLKIEKDTQDYLLG